MSGKKIEVYNKLYAVKVDKFVDIILLNKRCIETFSCI